MSTSAQIGATAANERAEQIERRLADLEAEKRMNEQERSGDLETAFLDYLDNWRENPPSSEETARGLAQIARRYSDTRLRGALERARPVLADAHADLNQRINDGKRATQMELALFSDLCIVLREVEAALRGAGEGG